MSYNSMATSWSCPKCSFNNHPDLLTCEICEYNCIDNINGITSSCNLQYKYTCKNATDGIVLLVETQISKMNSASKLSYPYCLHISQKEEAFSSSWSCGYRNIQMLCSSILQISVYNKALLSDRGSISLKTIPSIHEIQYILTKAWQEGFDPDGSIHFQGNLINSSKWIGTTECAVFFRYFGIDAKIVDFDTNNLHYTGIESENTSICDTNTSISNKRSWSNELIKDDDNTTTNVLDNTHIMNVSNRIFNWVDRYYAKNTTIGITPPLYLQHQGHSRTIIGFYRNNNNSNNTTNNNNNEDFNGLIIFDPSSSGSDIKISCETNNFKKWSKKLIKTKKLFNRKSYQILYFSSTCALMTEEERNVSKLLISQKDCDFIY